MDYGFWPNITQALILAKDNSDNAYDAADA